MKAPCQSCHIIKWASQTPIYNSQVCHTCQHVTVVMLDSIPTGVAVQLVKWYQFMAVHWQPNDRRHIQMFKAVPLDSYVICDVWSAILQPQVIPYSGLQYFSTLSFNRHDFPKENLFCYKMCVLIFPTIFLWNIFYYKKSRVRINKKYP